MVPFKQKYEKYIGKYIKYEFTGFGTYKYFKYGKITDIEINRLDQIPVSYLGGAPSYFLLDSENHFTCAMDFDCKRTKERIDRGEYTLFTEEDTENYDRYLIDSIK